MNGITGIVNGKLSKVETLRSIASKVKTGTIIAQIQKWGATIFSLVFCLIDMKLSQDTESFTLERRAQHICISSVQLVGQSFYSNIRAYFL